MEEHAERLFELIESKSFEELTQEERTFVLSHLTEQEFTLQRQVIAASTALEYEVEEPYALPIPQAKKPFLRRSIPLYQVVIGAACLVLLFLFAGNRNSYSINWRFPENPVEVSLANGAASVQIIRDTIVKEIPVFRPAFLVIHDTVTVVQHVLQQPEQRIQEVNQPIVYPELTEKLMESRSTPLKDDQTARFLPQISMTNSMK